MGESIVESPKIENKMGESITHTPYLQESVSFGRFEHDSLCWERWSTFPTNKYLEEVEKCSTPGSVAQKKAYFEAHYKRIAARKAELLEQEKDREAESANSENQIPSSLACNTKDLDVAKPVTQNSNEVNGVGNFTGEVSDKHIDIVSSIDDTLIQENEVTKFRTEVCEENGVTTNVASEVSENFKEYGAVNLTSEVNENFVENGVVRTEFNEIFDEPNDNVDVIEEVADLTGEMSDQINELSDEADVAEEKKKILPEHIYEPHNGADMINESQDIQTEPENVNKDFCLNMEIPELVKPNEPVLVKEIIASSQVWHDKEVLAQEKVEEREITEQETKKPVKLVDPIITKKEIGCTPLTSKKAARPESKKVLPTPRKQFGCTPLHMSLSLEQPDSDAASLTTVRKSLIMERMGDKDIVKRAFKSFQNVSRLAPSSLAKPTATKQPVTRSTELKASVPDKLQKKKEGASRSAKVTSAVISQQGTKTTLQSPWSKKNNGVDQRNGKAVPTSFGSRIPVSFGSRSQDLGRQQKLAPKKIEQKATIKDAGITNLQSKSKAQNAAEIGKPSHKINSKTKLSTSYNQGHGFLKCSMRKEDGRL
ncbi:Protein WVD2-like 7 [Bienertia sinuspersici]